MTSSTDPLARGQVPWRTLLAAGVEPGAAACAQPAEGGVDPAFGPLLARLWLRVPAAAIGA